ARRAAGAAVGPLAVGFLRLRRIRVREEAGDGGGRALNPTQWPRHLGKWIAQTRLVSRVLDALDARDENRMGERGMLAAAFQFAKINRVAGDYFEFGLWQGKTFSHAHRMRRRHGLKEMELWGFDSFQGL